MDKERVKQLQNDLWTATTRPGKAPPRAVLDAIRALSQLHNEIETLKVRV